MMPADYGEPIPWRPSPKDADIEKLRRRVEDLERHVNWILGQAANWGASCDESRDYD